MQSDGEEPKSDADADADAVNAEFWNDLAETLREIKIFGASDEIDDDTGELFESDEDESKWIADQQKLDEDLISHPLQLLSCDYMMKVHKWLKSSGSDLQTVAHRLMEDAKNDFSTDDVEEQARGIGEMLDVISWYHTLLSSKLSRAVGGLLKVSSGEGDVAGILEEINVSDANGSGKVALIAIERSIGAWVKLRAILPQSEDLILEMLSLLDRLRRRIRIDLPGAEAFRRPGFDGEDVGLFD